MSEQGSSDFKGGPSIAPSPDAPPAFEDKEVGKAAMQLGSHEAERIAAFIESDPKFEPRAELAAFLGDAAAQTATEQKVWSKGDLNDYYDRRVWDEEMGKLAEKVGSEVVVRFGLGTANEAYQLWKLDNPNDTQMAGVFESLVSGVQNMDSKGLSKIYYEMRGSLDSLPASSERSRYARKVVFSTIGDISGYFQSLDAGYDGTVMRFSSSLEMAANVRYLRENPSAEAAIPAESHFQDALELIGSEVNDWLLNRDDQVERLAGEARVDVQNAERAKKQKEQVQLVRESLNSLVLGSKIAPDEEGGGMAREGEDQLNSLVKSYVVRKDVKPVAEAGSLKFRVEELIKEKEYFVAIRSSGELTKATVAEIVEGDKVKLWWPHPTKPGKWKAKNVSFEDFLKYNY